MSLHDFLDTNYGADGAAELARRLAAGEDPNERHPSTEETPLHVATRRRRADAVTILLDHGADIDAKTSGGKSAWAHAIRRSFDDVAGVLAGRGASTELGLADRLAVAVVDGHLDEARKLLALHPEAVRTGNPEEDRLLADVAGRDPLEPVQMLIEAGADLTAPGLDGASPLHQAAWFGQPDNARLLIDAGAPLDVLDATHRTSPIGWVAHGSRYSGGAEERQDRYVALARMLVEAGASMQHPADPEGDGFRKYLLAEASPQVADVLKKA